MSGEVSPGQLDTVQDGPYFAYLSGEDYGMTISEGLGGVETDVPLGQLEVDTSGSWVQVSIEFTLPNDVPPGEYRVAVCNNPCRTGFGDLIGSTLFIGIDPPADDGGTSDKAAGHMANPSEVAASSALAVAEATDDVPEQVATSLALARHPARATGLNATWVAISAVFGLVVLLLVSVVRTEGG